MTTDPLTVVGARGMRVVGGYSRRRTVTESAAESSRIIPFLRICKVVQSPEGSLIGGNSLCPRAVRDVDHRPNRTGDFRGETGKTGETSEVSTGGKSATIEGRRSGAGKSGDASRYREGRGYKDATCKKPNRKSKGRGRGPGILQVELGTG
jgi:hypothetical protein